MQLVMFTMTADERERYRFGHRENSSHFPVNDYVKVGLCCHIFYYLIFRQINLRDPRTILTRLLNLTHYTHIQLEDLHNFLLKKQNIC